MKRIIGDKKEWIIQLNRQYLAYLEHIKQKLNTEKINQMNMNKRTNNDLHKIMQNTKDR